MGLADRLRRLFGEDAPGDQPAGAEEPEEAPVSPADDDEPAESDDPTTYPLW